MHADVVPLLRCPVCHGPLRVPEPVTGPLRCPRGHSFDQARAGYLQLTAGPLVHAGDSAAMVAARAEFLQAGHYRPITEALACKAVAAWPGEGLILDVGAGTGDHLAGVLDRLPDALGLALDVSRPAVRRAAHVHPRCSAVICDVWQQLPVADHTVGVLLNVFAPRSGPEFARALSASGAVLLVAPATDHLAELIQPLGLLRVDPAKPDRIAGALGTAFIRATETAYRWPMWLRREEVTALVTMGPSARHLDQATLGARIATLDEPVQVTASVTIGTYRLAGSGR